jgi:hypothetical protein
MSDLSYEYLESSDSEQQSRILERIRSSGRREYERIAAGEKPHVSGRHFYLTDCEEVELVDMIQQWSDIITQPTVSDVRCIVFSILFIVPVYRCFLPYF